MTRVEPLEARIAPATILPGNKQLIYTDIDGDSVTITLSDDILGNATIVFNTPQISDPGPQQLQLLDLSEGDNAAIDIKVTVKRGANGDGLADIGFIRADDLGTVTIPGDLGKIEAGDDNADKPGVKVLKVHSIGERGIDTQQAGGNLTSKIVGGIGSLTTKSNFAGELQVVGITSDARTGKIGKISIGGSIEGGDADNSGRIFTSGDIGTVVIKGSIVGGDGKSSGQINSGGGIKSIVIGGSLEGGFGGVAGGGYADIEQGSGTIVVGRTFAEDLGSITVGGDLRGHVGVGSGSILVNAESSLGTVTIKGSVIGSQSNYAGMIQGGEAIKKLTVNGSIIGQGGGFTPVEDAIGQVRVNGKIGPIVIKGDLIGGEGDSSGRIWAGSDIASLSIGGSLVGGEGNGSGSIDSGGSIGAVTVKRNVDRTLTSDFPFYGIIADDDIKSVKVGGFVADAVIGGGGQLGAVTVGGYTSSALFSGVGQENATKKDIAIKSVKVGGSARATYIYGGFDIRNFFDFPWENADGQIGPVSIGGDWIAGSISSGIDQKDSFIGNGDDALAPDDDQNILSRIASITIGGTVVGSPDAISSTDFFGFVAQSIGSLKVNGGKIKLTTDLDDILLSPITGDVRVKEFPI